ncbi:MAG: FG-GAP repeat protein, partial [Terracidiphilus sp.]
THPDGSVGFHLSGYGYGKKLNTPTAPKLAGDGTRLEYRRGNFTEWYVNSRKGLEQGFTLSQRPAGANNGQPLTIALGVTGTLSLSQQDGAVLLKSGKSTVLRYGGLSARDALDRAIPAHMEARNNEIRLVVDDQQAKYPLTVDPTWSQSQELTTPDPNSLDSFGISVSVSGPIAVIGAPEYWVNGHPGAGAAFVYIQSGSTWTLEQELSAWNANDPNYNFGCSVAVSGTTALIGECGGPDNRGAAYVFVHAGNSWSRQAELTSSDGVVNDQFGASVALSGTTAVIGATGLGSAYIFVQNGTTWTEQQELSGYGSLVSVSGITVVIGEASQIVGGNTGQGAAYVFVRDGQTWSQQQELTSSDGAAGDGFGGAVAVSGTMAVIGAPGKEIDGNYEQGAAYIFAQNGTTWSQQQELNASDGAVQDVFGGSVALSGTTAVIGAYGKEYSQGAAYVFVSSNGIWNQQQELSGGDSSHFGNSVGVIGPTLLIGAYGTNQGAGAAYVFTEGPAVPATLTTPSPGSALTSTSVEFTWSAVTGASATYDLHLSAVAPGGYDLYLSGHIAGTSTTATNLPINGGTIYARLYTFINGVTYYNDYTYTAMSVLLAQLTSPAPSSTLTSNPVNFTWSAGTAGSQYDLHLSAVAPRL